MWCHWWQSSPAQFFSLKWRNCYRNVIFSNRFPENTAEEEITDDRKKVLSVRAVMLHEAVSLQPPLLLFFSSSSSLSFFLYVGNGEDHSTTLVLAVSLSSLSLLTRRVQILDPSSKSCFANRKRCTFSWAETEKGERQKRRCKHKHFVLGDTLCPWCKHCSLSCNTCRRFLFL